MEHYMMISDAAKAVCVESHVLRYWEEELKLPIKRNELGHRYYTKEDVERFKQIKRMKEKGLQLKAIKLFLNDGKLNFFQEKGSAESKVEAKSTISRLNGASVRGEAVADSYHEEQSEPRINIVGCRECRDGRITVEAVASETTAASEAAMATGITETSESAIESEATVSSENAMVSEAMEPPEATAAEMSREDKAKRLQWLLRQLIRETLQENNEALCHEIRNSIVKELDYQFRNLEEREEERDLQRISRDEAYYRKMDELLRRKSRGGTSLKKTVNNDKVSLNDKDTNSGKVTNNDKSIKNKGAEVEKTWEFQVGEKKGKKKRHFTF